MSYQTKLLIDVRGVRYGGLIPENGKQMTRCHHQNVKVSPLWVVKLSVPLELFARNELLKLEGDIHGEGDDVVVEDHPEQEHLEDPDKRDLLELIKIPDPRIGDVGSKGIALVNLVPQETGQVLPETHVEVTFHMLSHVLAMFTPASPVSWPLDVGHVEEGVSVGPEEAQHPTQAEEVGVCPLNIRSVNINQKIGE